MRAAILTLLALFIGVPLVKAQDATPDNSVEVAPSQPARDPSGEPAPPPASARPAAPESTDLPPMATDANSLPDELSDAELQQFGLASTDPSIDYGIKLSGFMDFSGAIPIGETRNLMSKPSFAIGNLNVYISKNLTESVRTMAEVRVLYLPNGSPTSFTDRRLVSTLAADYNDFNRELRWGGVEIERAYLEWAIDRLLTVRVGQFLTPYGVWNVDHGSPTIIPTQRPFVIGYNFFPERQTGIEAYGRWGATTYGTFGYHLTLSNGTGPASEWLDLDYNKAVGARVFWEYRKWGELKLGGSAYYGQNTNSETSGRFVDGKLKTTEKILTQADSLALALDATFKYRGIHVQTEFLTQQLAFTRAGRTASLSIATFETNYPADGFRYGGYVLLGYRFDWFGVMPFVLLQRVGGVDSAMQAKDYASTLGGGLNVRPVESIVVKVEYTQVMFDKGQAFPGFDLQLVSAQLAWAF